VESRVHDASQVEAPVRVRLAALIASPSWRRLAASDADMQRRFTTEWLTAIDFFVKAVVAEQRH
jgi:hypothetical protein